jgi:hypothetical protein
MRFFPLATAEKTGKNQTVPGGIELRYESVEVAAVIWLKGVHDRKALERLKGAGDAKINAAAPAKLTSSKPPSRTLRRARGTARSISRSGRDA